jgi:hypothetical protein
LSYSYLTSIDTEDLHVAKNVKASEIPNATHLVEADEDEPEMGTSFPMLYDDVLDHFWVAPPYNLIIYNGEDPSKFKEIANTSFHGNMYGHIYGFALFTGELGSSSKTNAFSYVPRVARSGLNSTPEEYYKSLK